MLGIVLWTFVFIVGLVFLVQSSDYFTEAAEKVGLHFKIPPFIVGVTIVSVGTSLPELVSSLFAVTSGAGEIVVGNVIGSNIANIFLVLGIASVLCRPLRVTRELIHVDLPMLVGSAFLLAAMLWDGVYTAGEGILSLMGVILYFGYIASSQPYKAKKKAKKLGWKAPVTLILTAIIIYFSARFTIEAVIALSQMLTIGTELIAVTAVALGTSLPEIAVSVHAALKGKAEMAVGNVLGSNIFNSLAVMGIPALIAPLPVPQPLLMFALPMMIIATFLYFFIEQDREITPWEGGFLLVFYLFFIMKMLQTAA